MCVWCVECVGWRGDLGGGGERDWVAGVGG